jgi:serine/threonine protein kinase
MYSGSARKRVKTETLPEEEEDRSGEETSVNEEDKEATTSGEDPSGEETSVDEEDEEVTSRSGGVKPIFSGTAPKCYWTQTLPAKEEDPSGAETSVNEEDEKGCFRFVERIYPSELKIMRKIAKGGQAKIFLAKYLKTQQDVVVKTYRCGVNPGELLRRMESAMKGYGQYSGLCRMIGVSVDEKGRVSTVMELMAGDLRNFIDHKNLRLSYKDKIVILRAIARGMEELHGCGFIHKDLKASNVLVSPIPIESMHIVKGDMFGMHPLMHRFDPKSSHFPENHHRMGRLCEWSSTWLPISPDLPFWEWIDVKIGDYESSDGVAGTGFFRAPEVLRALQDGTNVEYSAAVDVYGFGMVCYELLTGKLPFQGHPLSDYDLVLSGKRPDMPEDWESWVKTLLQRCWDEDPHQRPGWGEILDNLTQECLSLQRQDQHDVSAFRESMLANSHR